jgi:hypothetical protein
MESLIDRERYHRRAPPAFSAASDVEWEENPMGEPFMAKTLAAAVIGLSAIVTLSAHHSMSAEFDASRTVELKGVVTRFEWRNPHSSIYFDVRDAAGATTQWQAELAGGAGELVKKGWSATSVKAGDTIVAKGFPTLPGSQRPPALALVELTLPDGTKLDADVKSPIWGGLPAVK